MTWLEILAVAVGLALDAAAVSLGAGASGRARGTRAAFRLAFHFGLFQFLMPLLGLARRQRAGRMAGCVRPLDRLRPAGGRRRTHGARGAAGATAPRPPPTRTRGWSLVALSVATSIDALAVGLGLALLGVSLWLPCLVIGLVAAAMSLAALQLGRALGTRLGSRMEIAGGLVLLVIGANVLISHLRG